MIVVKLLNLRVQPVFVFVDTETGDVEPGPVIEPANIKASQLAELPQLLDAARVQVEQTL